ncbi:DNA packaging protein, QLRG family [Lactobacillus crispatus MV-3A-US]|uniref:head-tail connector protein n=1 Tax=Lactobacillus crispatus TaxID=47770 RepID=UPI0001BAE2D6|nr:head-tail connector protein [Lactobacillus crispatus]EEX28332.1 DNA packaging protein, QLRG family [Lactobacillus crispatus MV-3A-US]
MTTYLTIDDGLKRSLGYLPDDDALDFSDEERMKATLKGAENYVQGAIGDDADESFYKTESVFELYKLAVNAIAANWFLHPTSAVSSTTAKQIIGQLRGAYDETKVVNDDGTTTDMGPTE